MAGRNSPFCCCVSLPRAAFPPHFFGLAQRNGVEPQRKALMGWWRPREVSGPTRLSHSRGRCHSAAKVSASRTYFITRPRGEGLGLAEVSPSKSFLPRFFTKKRAGSRGGALAARRSARNTPSPKKRRRGSKGEPSPGVPPLRAAPAARSPCDAVGSVVNERRAGVEPRPYGGWRNVVRPAVAVGAGRRGRRPLQGGRGDVGPAIIPRRAGLSPRRSAFRVRGRYGGRSAGRRRL